MPKMRPGYAVDSNPPAPAPASTMTKGKVDFITVMGSFTWFYSQKRQLCHVCMLKMFAQKALRHASYSVLREIMITPWPPSGSPMAYSDSVFLWSAG